MRRVKVSLHHVAGGSDYQRRLHCSDCGLLERIYPTRTDAEIAAKNHRAGHAEGIG